MKLRANSASWFWTDDGIFYQGRRVVVYLRRQFWGESNDKEYKFHVTGCSLLRGISNIRRYGKYVATTKTDGIFQVTQVVENGYLKNKIPLHVCKHCLNDLNWRGYKKALPSVQNEIYENFSIAEFFQYMDDESQENNFLNVHLETWKIISKVIQTKFGYVCDECRSKILHLSDLHIDNINGRQFDCRRENLKVLCATCYQKKYGRRILGGTKF